MNETLQEEQTRKKNDQDKYVWHFDETIIAGAREEEEKRYFQTAHTYSTSFPYPD